MEQMACPVCKKRFFDVSKIPIEKIEIEAKCPHCGKISKLEISSNNKKRPYRAKK